MQECKVAVSTLENCWLNKIKRKKMRVQFFTVAYIFSYLSLTNVIWNLQKLNILVEIFFKIQYTMLQMRCYLGNSSRILGKILY